MGTVHLVLAISMLIATVCMYFYLPIVSPKLQNEPYWWLLLLAPLSIAYMFSVNATYWFQTGRRLDYFVRASPGGLCARFPEERGWFLPGYKIVETTIPWKEIRNCFATLHFVAFIPADSSVSIVTTNGEIVSISTCHFTEGRRQFVNNIIEATRYFQAV
jgi:hypothetical protein